MSQPHSNNSRVVVFDLDGTLVDAFADIAAAMNAPLAARGLPTHTVATICTMVGDGAGKLIERAAPAGASPALLATLKEEMIAHYSAHPADHASVYPGVFPLLDRLRAQGIRLAVLSNKPHEMTLKTCAVLGLSPHFDEIVGEVEPDVPRKPDPTGLLAMLRRLGAEQALLVGDGVPDGQVAANAGIPFIAALWGSRTRDQLAPLNPIAFAETVPELEGIVTARFARGDGEW